MNKKYITKYRIVNNPSYNDFNDELPYTIVAVDYDPKTDLIRQRGFNGWSKISDKLYDTRQECEKHFVFEINYELGNNAADLQHRLEAAEIATKLACDYLVSVEGDELYELCKDIYNDNDYLMAKMNYFKELAEKELKGEGNGSRNMGIKTKTISAIKSKNNYDNQSNKRLV